MSRVLTSGWAWLLVLAVLTAGCSSPDPREPSEQGAPTSATSAPPPETPLPDEKIRSEIAKGASHHYTEHLERGALLYLRVEQLGADVKIEITRASEAILSVDLRIDSQGIEEVWWIAPETARYGISITASGAGAYTLEADLRPAATEVQKLRSRAQDAASEARGHKSDGAAAPGFARAAALWRESGDTWQAALAWAEAGHAAERADQPEAVEWLDRALELFQELDRPRQVTMVLLWRAQAFKDLGQLRRARDDQRRAIELANLHQDRLREARGRNDLAVLQLQHGDYDEALGGYRQAARLWRQAGRRSEAKACNGMAEIYMRLGGMDEAKAELDRALEIDDENSRPRTLMLIGWWHYLESDAEAALDSYHDAAREGNGPNAGLLDRMGSAHAQRGEWDLAKLRYERALEILGPGGPQLDLAHTFSNQARLSLHTGDAAAGFAPCERAVQIFRRLGDRDSESHALWTRARLHRRLGNLQAARQDLDAAVILLEDLRVAAGTPASRATFLAERIEIYQLYVEVLMELHREQSDRGWDILALNVSERARARSLLDLLAEAGVDLGVDAELLDQQRWLAAEIAELDAIAATRKDAKRRKTAERDLKERLREREQLLQQIRKAATSTGRLAQPQPIEAEEIGELLDDDTLFLAYGFGSEHAFLWWIDGSGVLGSTPLAEEVTRIERRAEEWYRLLSDPGRGWDWRKGVQRAEELRDLLLRPAADPIGRARRLVIVGDGSLRSIPFAALPALDDDEKALVTTHEIVHLSSASTLALMRERILERSPAPEPLLAIGDPVYDRRDERLKGAARSPKPGKPDRLKHSGEEVRQILAVVDCKDCGLLGFEANLGSLLAADLSRYRILHFAAHSEINRKSPNLSAIRLSRFDRLGNPREDSLLRFYEIFDLDLPAELVVLSACSTALGEELPGEGLIGLSRAFNYAGTPRALMTLWDVPDESTAILMTRFYKGLFHHGLAPAAALRRAQLEMIDDGGWKPYHWAAFVFQGEWRPFDVLDADD